MAEAKNETANYHYKALYNNTTFFINKLYLFVSVHLPRLTEFIVGDLDISEWSNYVNEYNMLGGNKILIGMKQYYKETLGTADRVNSVISIFQPKSL